jgi:hypothetical protein
LPCGQGLIYNAISFTSLSNEARSVLHGVVTGNGNDQALKEFLASFVIPGNVCNADPISTTISEVDIKRDFKVWRETTTTSPSGRHLGHYSLCPKKMTPLDTSIRKISGILS